jgi:hypothetical protein
MKPYKCLKKPAAHFNFDLCDYSTHSLIQVFVRALYSNSSEIATDTGMSCKEQ